MPQRFRRADLPVEEGLRAFGGFPSLVLRLLRGREFLLLLVEPAPER